jgi:putative PIN family toxin of toxin-antitoxin system
MGYQVILDTNVLVAAFRSKQGASFRLLSLLAENDVRFQINVSSALVLEYEAVLKREQLRQEKDLNPIDAFLDDLVARANRHSIFFWIRPFLPDAGDDFILELAMASETDFIVTYNTKNFLRAKQLGMGIITPRELLQKIGEIA